MTPRPQIRTLPRVSARRFDWLTALILLGVGVGGLYLVITTMSPIAAPLPDDSRLAALTRAFFDAPNVGSLVLLLSALGIAVWGGAWFIVRLLHWRFRPAFEPAKVWRQSLWVALYTVVSAWLQLNRSLTVALGMLLAGAFVLAEVFLNVRERQE